MWKSGAVEERRFSAAVGFSSAPHRVRAGG